MGQYIYAAITHNVKIMKKELEKYHIDKNNLMEYMKNEIDLSCFDFIEFDDYVEFRAKENIFNSQELAGFIKEQSLLFNDRKDTIEEVEELSLKLKELSQYDEIVELAKTKSYCNFQELSGIYSINYGFRSYFSAEVKSILFFMEGKAYLECYDSLFKYIEVLIKKSSNYTLSNMVKLYLE